MHKNRTLGLILYSEVRSSPGFWRFICFHTHIKRNCLLNTNSVATSLDEIKRVLKNDGKIVLMEFSKSDNLIIKVFYKFYLNIFIPFIGLLFGKFAEYKYLASSIESFYTPKEMNKILNSKRLNVIQNIKYNFGLVSVYISNNSKS